MRSRGGAFSLITYVLYTIFSIAATLLVHSVFPSWKDATELPLLAMFLMAFELIPIVFGIFSIALLVLKLLHMGTRFVLFGIPCLLADVYIIWHVVSTIISIGAITGEMLVLLPLLFLSVGSFISNVRSF